jgi:hypothetical protein
MATLNPDEDRQQTPAPQMEAHLQSLSISTPSQGADLPVSLLSLPDDILLEILSFSGVPDILSLREVSGTY